MCHCVPVGTHLSSGMLLCDRGQEAPLRPGAPNVAEVSLRHRHIPGCEHGFVMKDQHIRIPTARHQVVSSVLDAVPPSIACTITLSTQLDLHSTQVQVHTQASARGLAHALTEQSVGGMRYRHCQPWCACCCSRSSLRLSRSCTATDPI